MQTSKGSQHEKSRHSNIQNSNLRGRYAQQKGTCSNNPRKKCRRSNPKSQRITPQFAFSVGFAEMRKADYTLLARILREQNEHATANHIAFSQGDVAKQNYWLGFRNALQIMRLSFAELAHVDRDKFIAESTPIKG